MQLMGDALTIRCRHGTPREGTHTQMISKRSEYLSANLIAGKHSQLFSMELCQYLPEKLVCGKVSQLFSEELCQYLSAEEYRP
jgi:hypothetical protein